MNYETTKIDLGKTYFNMTKEQRMAVELYLIAKSQLGQISDYPNIIGIDKEGNICSFKEYKALHSECEKEKCIWNINLFYTEFLRVEKGRNLLSYIYLNQIGIPLKT